MPEQKPTHTPGPWKARPDSGDGKSSWSVYAVHGSKRYICTTFENQQADANLIAAAPDLLEALREIAELPDARSDEACTIARAAIAKATGG